MIQPLSFEHACEIKGVPTTLPDVSSWPAAFRRGLIAFYKLTVIRDAIVGNWVPDWNNSKQRKWGCWFCLDKPGFRFNDSYYAVTFSYATCGSRLCCETEDQATYFGKIFLNLWEEWLTFMPAAEFEVPAAASNEQQALTLTPPSASSKELALEIAMKYAAKGTILEEAKKIYEWLTAA